MTVTIVRERQRGTKQTRPFHLRIGKDPFEAPDTLPFSLLGRIARRGLQEKGGSVHDTTQLWTEYMCATSTVLSQIATGYQEAERAGIKIPIAHIRSRRLRPEVPRYLQGHCGIADKVVLPLNPRVLQAVEEQLTRTISRTSAPIVHAAYIAHLVHTHPEHARLAPQVDEHPIETLDIFWLLQAVRETQAIAQVPRHSFITMHPANEKLVNV